MLKLSKNEKLKDIPGYEGVYAITSRGNVWSYRSRKLIKPYVDDHGYLRIPLTVRYNTKAFKVHRLVAMLFVGNPEGKPQVNHKNGKKTDNRACNLEWCTARENMQHATDMGLNKVFKLEYSDKIIAAQLHNLLGYGQTQLARSLGVTPGAVNYIAKAYWPLPIDA